MQIWSRIYTMFFGFSHNVSTLLKDYAYFREVSTQQTFQRCFNVIFWLIRLATWENVKSTLKQRCVFQRWNLQRQINVESTFYISTFI